MQIFRTDIQHGISTKHPLLFGDIVIANFSGELEHPIKYPPVSSWSVWPPTGTTSRPGVDGCRTPSSHGRHRYRRPPLHPAQTHPLPGCGYFHRGRPFRTDGRQPHHQCRRVPRPCRRRAVYPGTPFHPAGHILPAPPRWHGSAGDVPIRADGMPPFCGPRYS